MTLVLAVSKGKRAPYVVKPLADAAPSLPDHDRPLGTPETGDSITPKQLTALNAALSQDLGFTERDDKLAWLSAELGREIGSSKDVTKSEAGRLLDGFAAALATTEPTLPDAS